MKNKKLLKRAMSMLLALCMILSALVIPSETGAKAYAADDGVGECRLVFGDKNLADEDAMILTIFGDGYTAEEQDKFYSDAQSQAEYLVNSSPYDEFKDTFKIYAIGTISNESGVKGDKAATYEEAYYDTRDTYFGSYFFAYGMERLTEISEEGYYKGLDLINTYKPQTDAVLYMLNSEAYGGSGGTEYAIASLNDPEIAVHETAHSIGGLQDEYYAPGYEEERDNLTQETDPTKIRWSRFIGKNGVGIYAWGNAGTGWYKPSQTCKMEALGAEDHPFCEVCKEILRQRVSEKSNVTHIFFQPYADQFVAGQAKDMSEYFILRKAGNEITGDKLGDLLKLTYYDADGKKVEGIPSEAGTYSVKAEFAGNDTYDACSMTASYTIGTSALTVNIANKMYDGKPSALDFNVVYDKAFKLQISYSGTQTIGTVTEYFNSTMESDTVSTSDDMYSIQDAAYDSTTGEYFRTKTYQSKTGGPKKPGEYTVTVTVYDAESGVEVASQSRTFQINYISTQLVNNNDQNYWGATDYYNNQPITIMGEGFTKSEQAKFNKLAKQLVAQIQKTEPFKETQLYFNFTTINCISQESGIGTKPKDTFFRMTYDKKGNLVASDSAANIAGSLNYYNVNMYSSNTIVIVNDKKAKQSAVSQYWGQTIFITPDTTGMKYAASELLNYLTGHKIGYRAKTTKAKSTIRKELLTNLSDCGYYPVITSRAYDVKYVVNGKRKDLSSTFHVYYYGKEIKDVKLKITYYSDKNGKPYKKLSKAPSKAGTYHAKAELVVDETYGYAWSEQAQDYLYPARGWTTFTIKAKSKK